MIANQMDSLSYSGIRFQNNNNLHNFLLHYRQKVLYDMANQSNIRFYYFYILSIKQQNLLETHQPSLHGILVRCLETKRPQDNFVSSALVLCKILLYNFNFLGMSILWVHIYYQRIQSFMGSFHHQRIFYPRIIHSRSFFQGKIYLNNYQHNSYRSISSHPYNPSTCYIFGGIEGNFHVYRPKHSYNLFVSMHCNTNHFYKHLLIYISHQQNKFLYIDLVYRHYPTRSLFCICRYIFFFFYNHILMIIYISSRDPQYINLWSNKTLKRIQLWNTCQHVYIYPPDTNILFYMSQYIVCQANLFNLFQSSDSKQQMA